MGAAANCNSDPRFLLSYAGLFETTNSCNRTHAHSTEFKRGLDLEEVGKDIGRSKTASLIFLDERLGHLRLPELDRERFIKFGKERALEGAGPVTVGIDLGYIKTILSHAAAVHGVIVSTEPIDLARIALGRLGLVGKGDERDRRPTQDELDRIVSASEATIRQQIPVGRVIRFAVATAMRQDEIARVEWRDFDASARMLLIRNRKDPRKKKGNDQRIPLLDVSGYDACKIIEEQGRFSNTRGHPHSEHARFFRKLNLPQACSVRSRAICADLAKPPSSPPKEPEPDCRCEASTPGVSCGHTGPHKRRA